MLPDLGIFRLWRSPLRILLFLLLLGIGLVSVELLVRAFKAGGEARRDAVEASYMPLRLRPDFAGRVVSQPIRTNRYGFRGSENFPKDPPPGEIRILGLGDSVAFGLGLAAEKTFLHVAGERLNERSASLVRVINAAGQGYSPSSYHAYLVHDGLAFSPDLVVVPIELCNDVSDEALLRGPLPEGRDPAPRVRGGRYVISWDGNLLGGATLGPYFFEKTYTYTFLLRRSLTRLDAWFPDRGVTRRPGATFFHLGFDRFLLSEAGIEKGWQRLFDALKATRDVLESRQIPMLLLILPSRYVFLERPLPDKTFARGLVERAETMARERGIPFLGVEEELAHSGGTSLYFDFAHLTAKGNSVVGDKLARHIAVVVPRGRGE